MPDRLPNNTLNENVIAPGSCHRARPALQILPDDPAPDPAAQDSVPLITLRPKVVERISIPRRLASFSKAEEDAVAALTSGAMTFPYRCPAVPHKEFMERLHRLHPELLLALSHYTIHATGRDSCIRVEYNAPAQVVSNLKEQIRTGVRDVAAMIPRSLPPHIKLQRLYEWFCRNITYNHQKHEYDFCAAGVFTRHTAVCAGISQAFMLVCLRMGIPCGIALGNTSTAAEATHCWNVVRLQDAYYHIDVTTGICYYAQLHRVSYPLFCVPESELRRQRYIHHASHLPESTAFDFAHQSGQQFNVRSDVDKWIRAHLKTGNAITVKYPPHLWPSIDAFSKHVVQTCQRLFPGKGMHTMNHANDWIIISLD